MKTGNLNIKGLLENNRIDIMENNIMLLAFYRASDQSKPVYNLDNTVIDEYQDETGIDTGTSTNESYDSPNDLYQPVSSGSVVQPFTHMKLNDDAGNTTITDDGTGTNNGISSVNTSTATAIGKINKAFQGNSNYFINIDSVMTDIKNDTTGSFSFWFYHSNNSNCFSFADSSAISALFMETQNGVMVARLVSAGTEQWRYKTPASSIPTNTWFHCVLVQDGLAPKMYLNGVNQTLTAEDTTDTTKWLSGISGVDNGRIGANKWNGSSEGSLIRGRIDEFRYYQNKALNQTEIDAIYNSGTGTEDGAITGTTENMTLVSVSNTADTTPDNARIVMLQEDVDSVTLNTDLKVSVSRDGGTTYTQVTLEDEGNITTAKQVFSAMLDISAQPSGTSMKYKIETANNKDMKIHAMSLSWS